MGRISIFATAFRPSLKKCGLYYLRVMVISLLTISVPLCILHGTVYKRTTYTYRAALKIVDFDHGTIGAQISQTLLMQNNQYRSVEKKSRPVWRQSFGEFRSAEEVQQWVRLHGWGALVINAGASEQLERALQGAESETHNPKALVTFFLSAGHQPIMYQVIESAAAPDVNKAMQTFAVGLIQNQTAFEQTPTNSLAQLVTQPIGYQIVNVAPYAFNMWTVAFSFGILVGTLCTESAMVEWKLRTLAFFLRVKLHHLWLATLAVFLLWAAYFGMFAALALAAFEGPGYKQTALPFTVGRFFSIWGVVTVTLLAITLWLFIWYMLLSPDLWGLVSLITAIANVASTMVIVELAPHFFRWFYALPYYNGSMLYRYILSGGYPHLGINLGVILSEICGMAGLLYVVTWIRQATLLLGIADVSGWLRSSMFFDSPVVYYKDRVSGRTPPTTAAGAPLTVVDSINRDACLRVGNLGV